MNAKQIVLLTLSCLLSIGIFGLTGCSGSENQSGSKSADASVSVKSQESTFSFKTDTTIEETVLLDDENISIKATSLAFRNNNAYLNLDVANKTTEKVEVTSGTIGSGSNFINDYMVSGGYMLCDLEPNASSSEELWFSMQELSLFGIDAIGEIGLSVNAQYDAMSDAYSEMGYETLFKGPLVIKTSAYDESSQTENTYQKAISNEQLLSSYDMEKIAFSDSANFEQNGISIKSIALLKNKDSETSLLIEIENATDSTCIATASDILINGKMAYEGSWTATSIYGNKYAVMNINLNDAIDENELDSFDLNNVGTIGIDFEVKDDSGNTVLPATELEFSF